MNAPAATFTGKPCRTCGGTLRYVIERKCVACVRRRVDRYLVKHRTRVKRRARQLFAKRYADPTYRADWSARHKAARARNPDHVERREFLKRLEKIGATVEQFDRMIVEQVGRCADCGVPMVTGPSTCKRPDSMTVDHDHSKPNPGIRVLLCRVCNIHNWRDDIATSPVKFPRSIRERSRIGRYFSATISSALDTPIAAVL